MSKVILIAALANARVIGCNNTIPWHLPEDLKHFKEKTLHHVVVMGRKTYESIGQKPLPQRRNIVVTRQTQWKSPGVEVVHNIPAALSLLQDEATLYILGGSSIYEASLPFADELCLTKIELTVVGDRFFPFINLVDWQIKTQETHQAKNGLIYHLVSYVRVSSLKKVE